MKTIAKIKSDQKNKKIKILKTIRKIKSDQKNKTIKILTDKYGLKKKPAKQLTMAIYNTGKDFRKQIFFFGTSLRSNPDIRDKFNNGNLTIEELINYDFSCHFSRHEVKIVTGPIVGATICPQCNNTTLVVDLIRKPSMGRKCEHAYKRQCLNTSCRFISIV